MACRSSHCSLHLVMFVQQQQRIWMESSKNFEPTHYCFLIGQQPNSCEELKSPHLSNITRGSWAG